MTIILAAVLVAAVLAWSARAVVRELAASRAAVERGRLLTILATFAPAVAESQRDPRAILHWQPVAGSARQLFPEAFALIDKAHGSRFPFPRERIENAHARWTADWLAWERTHDAEYKRKVAEIGQELMGDTSPAARARVDAVEREKLDLYQRRYEEYIRVAKALDLFAKS